MSFVLNFCLLMLLQQLVFMILTETNFNPDIHDPKVGLSGDICGCERSLYFSRPTKISNWED